MRHSKLWLALGSCATTPLALQRGSSGSNLSCQRCSKFAVLLFLRHLFSLLGLADADYGVIHSTDADTLY